MKPHKPSREKLHLFIVLTEKVGMDLRLNRLTKNLKGIRAGICLLSIVFLSQNVSGDQHAQMNLKYLVQPGDDLGSVLRGFGICQLWGPNHQIERTLALAGNQKIILAHGDLMFPGATIELPKDHLKISSSLYQIKAGNRVEFTELPYHSQCPHELSWVEKHPEDQGGKRIPATVANPTPSPVPTPIVVPELAPTPVCAPSPVLTQVATPAVVVAAPVPIPTPTTAAAPQFKTYGLFDFDFRPFYLRIDATDASSGSMATLLSQLSETLNLKWTQVWSPSIHTDLESGYTFYKMTQPTGSSTLDTLSSSGSHYSFGVTYLPEFADHRLELGGDAGVEQMIYIRSLSYTQIHMDEIAVPTVKIRAKDQVFKVDTLGAGVQGGFNQYFGTPGPGYSIRSSTGYNGAVFINQLMGTSTQLRGESGLQQFNQKSGLGTQKSEELYFEFGLSVRFGADHP